jgi:uncharacterized membrane protein
MFRSIGLLSLVLVITLIFTGCTITPKATPAQNEEILVAAGFEFKEADTPEKMEHLKALPQGKFLHHQVDGKSYYLYADSAECKCLWKGDRAAFTRYREIARERKDDYAADLYESQNEELPHSSGWVMLVEEW